MNPESKLPKRLAEFINDPKATGYALRKVGSKRASMVSEGQTIIGDEARAVEVVGKAGILVNARHGFDFIRTSPVVGIVKETPDSVEFETEGGYYLLVKVRD